MSLALVGVSPFRAVLGYEKMLDEHGREMHGSLGNAIAADEAFQRMGADVMRWLYCRQPPNQNLRFGFGPAEGVRRELLRLWNSVKFLGDYASIEDFRPRYEDLAGAAEGELKPLDAWLAARTSELVAEATDAYEAFLTHRVIDAFATYVADLSNWYIRRSRRRFWDGDESALRTLWTALVQALRVISPVMPFLADDLWQNLVRRACPGAPESVFLAGWPEPQAGDAALLAEVAEARRVVELGHRARGEAGIKVRQTLRTLYVRGADGSRAHADELGEELNVEEVRFDEGPVVGVQLKPNLPLLGPRLGSRLRDVKAALEQGDYEVLEDGRVRAAGEELAPEEVIRGERIALEGFAIAEDDSISVALSTVLDDDLRRKGRAREWSHRINQERKELGLELTDRVVVTLPGSEEDLAEHADWIKAETLAVELRFEGDALGIARA
jgi:isoleucyl-tRNA synthetase